MQKSSFVKLSDGTEIEQYTLKNAKGTVAKVITYGAILTELWAPDKNGKNADVVLGFDNLKHKYVGGWIDNMGTGIMMADGTYDPATKTFTYTGEVEAIPGMKQKIREVIRITDKDHHTFEWYEDRGGQEAKTMEIKYTRKK